MQVPETGRVLTMYPELHKVQAFPEKLLQLAKVDGMALQAPETK
jgi:hypothetical protein